MMNTRGHLPAGQQVQSGADMGPVPAAGGPGSGRGGRPQHYVPPHHHHHHHYHQQPAVVGQSMYPGYMAPMANAYTAAPYYVHHQPYSNGAMPSPAYMPYPPSTGYARSPPSMQHYHVPLPQTYPRLAQHSPIVSSPYHVPPPPVPTTIPLPHTPSSTHSHVVPPPMTPSVQQVHEMVQRPESAQTLQHPEPEREPQPHPESQPVAQPEQEPSQQHSVPQAQQSPTRSLPLHNEPFRPPLPWLSVPDAPFPSRASKLRRRKLLGADAERLELPNQHNPVAEASSAPRKDVAADEKQDHKSETRQQAVSTPQPESNTTNETLPARSETPSTQDQPSEDTVSTSPTTPSSVQQPQSTPTIAVKPVAQSTVSAVPAVPVIPALPKAGPKEPKPAGGAENSSGDAKVSADAAGSVSGETPADSSADTAEATTDAVPSAPAPPKPKLWTGLFAKPAPAASQSSATIAFKTNGDAAAGTSSTSGAGSGFAKANASSLAEALEAYRPGAQDKLVFVEPRGLVNTGNMCYMNSVLQVLIFCIPFFDFLDQVGKKAAHSFKSDTPLLDAMIMFMREFKVIDSAASAEQLKKRLKSEEYEQYGEPFTPEFVYDAIRKLPRFASMRRGHQQDAQEFLGFLLEGLHDECSQVMRAASTSISSTAPSSSLPSPTSNVPSEGGDDWLEVGPRQRSAVTRSSGHSHTLSPITKIFGGQLRSELRVPGNKNSVTLEPYQPLQLDIGSPEIRNIIDALKGLTRPEVLHGDFNSPHGKDVRATKQVFIESVPPVLILHLKRFQFDAEGLGGTVKIWKKIGYPLEFEFPREVLSRQKRNSILAENSGAPRYRLIAVVYHHGKNASGGHYTVDVRRQDGREWIRIDDTVIRRVRDEDVAEGGAEEDAPKVGSGDHGRREVGNPGTSNRFVGINDEDAGDDGGWKQATPGKKWSSVVNGGASPASSSNGQKAAAKQHKESMKENKVAYLLFYQRI